MSTVVYYEIVVKLYHDEIIGRLRYVMHGELQESALYSLPELNNLLVLWRHNELSGTFGVHPLSPTATFQIVTE